MKRIPAVVYTACALLSAGSAAAAVDRFKGMCEASTAEAIDAGHFVVASDETNELRIYALGAPDPVVAKDLNFTKFDKSDLEASTRVGQRIYWLSSHSFNSSGEDKDKRKVFFATEVTADPAKPLKKTGKTLGKLRDFFPAALKSQAAAINIEGMASTGTGGLYLGFRGPLAADQRAMLLPFENPAEVIESGADPKFGKIVPIALDGRGIRSIVEANLPNARYLIVGGPVADGDGKGFALYTWSGDPATAPARKDVPEFSTLKPEAMFVVPGTNKVEILSDDDDVGAGGKPCQDDDPEQKNKTFRRLEISF